MTCDVILQPGYATPRKAQRLALTGMLLLRLGNPGRREHEGIGVGQGNARE